MQHYSVSVVIPTFNCAAILRECLAALRRQKYPQELVEIILVDGFSNDSTRVVGESFGAVILDNPEVIHPKGRPIGFRRASGELILCLDSDNIITDKNWLREMTAPFADPGIAASEPLYYSSRNEDSWVTRYCSLIGADDPLVVYFGFHERYSWLTGTWTSVPRSEKDKGGYLEVRFIDPDRIPSLGANGFMVRKSLLDKVDHDPFHHVNVSRIIIANGGDTWAKVKTGVVHKHGSGLSRFLNKKRRRVERRLDSEVNQGYTYPLSKAKLAWVLIRSCLVFPVLIDVLRGVFRRPTPLWLYHFPVLYGTLSLYAYVTLLRMVSGVKDKDYEKV